MLLFLPIDNFINYSMEYMDLRRFFWNKKWSNPCFLPAGGRKYGLLRLCAMLCTRKLNIIAGPPTDPIGGTL
jgi:hypothetical protein